MIFNMYSFKISIKVNLHMILFINTHVGIIKNMSKRCCRLLFSETCVNIDLPFDLWII